MYRFPFAVTLMAGALSGTVAQAQWTPVTFTVQPSTALTLIGDIGGVVPFVEQAPGSLTAHGVGTIAAELWGSPGAYTQIRFPGGSAIGPVPQPGPFAPGDAPADFAAIVDLTDLAGVVGTGAFRNDMTDLTGGPLAIDASGDFLTTGLTLTVTAGTFYYDVPGVVTGSNDFYFSAPVMDPLLGHLAMTGDGIDLTLDYSGFSSTTIAELGDVVFNYGVSGQFVGHASAVPEPSAVALAIVALLSVVAHTGLRRKSSSQIA